MASMFPNVYLGDNDNSEGDIFRWFQQDEYTRNWRVHHSVKIAAHVSQTQGEADFIVIVPGYGVVVLEIKSWSMIRCDYGHWKFGRNGTIQSDKDPIVQARDNAETVRRYLLDNGFSEKDISVTWAIVFPNGHYHNIDGKGIENFDDRIVDFDDLNSDDPEKVLRDKVKSVLVDLYGQRNQYGQVRSLSAENAERISNLIRKQYEVSSDESVRQDRINVAARKCTESQKHILECLEENDRILLLGAAGTGKTFVAKDAVARERLNHLDADTWKVGFFCFNALLGQNLEKWAESVDRRRVVAGTLQTYVSRMVKGGDVDKYQLSSESEKPSIFRRIIDSLRGEMESSVGSGDDQLEQAESVISDRLARSFLKLPPEKTDGVIDFLVVDEFQDLLTEKNYAILDRLLKGGLRNGRWLICGDYENQYIQTQVGEVLSPQCLRNEKELSFTICRLKENCRNSRPISLAITNRVSPKTKYTRMLREDSLYAPLVYSVRTNDIVAVVSKIKECRARLLEEGVPPNEITVAFSDGRMFEDVWRHITSTDNSEESLNWQKTGTSATKSRMITIPRFKGLDSRAVILVLDDTVELPPDRLAGSTRQSSLLYVGMTRASLHLVILAPQRFSDQYNRTTAPDNPSPSGSRKKKKHRR